MEAEISFEHFDPEYELCNLDENGKPIKPRKKPGRKPNPPSPAQRKAQNRAAQRAFRERKRREMKDAETNIKKCLQMRDQAVREAKLLQKKVEELRYENHFLKGQVLTFKIACIANRVDVPKFWDTGMRDKMGSDITTLSRTKDIPQSLEFFLDKNKHIITMTNEDMAPYETTPSSPELNNYQQQQNYAHSIDSAIASMGSPINVPKHENFSSNGFNGMPMPVMTNSTTTNGSTSNDSFMNPIMHDPLLSQPTSLMDSLSSIDLNNTVQNALSQTNLDPSFIQHFLQPDVISDILDQMKDVPPELWLNMVPNEISSLIPPEIRSFLNQPHEINILEQLQLLNLDPVTISAIANEFISSHQLFQQQPHPQLQDIPTPPIASSVDTDCFSASFKPEVPKEEDFWAANPNLSTSPASNKVYVAGPIPPLEAVTRMRTMRDQNDNRYLLTPTELQRHVPHDPRIDLIPGPTMRDFMIIFQDFYDANELFNLLLESAMFIGGELGNPDCWYVPPVFIRKYWFLCPTYKPTRPDNAVELAVYFAQKMINALKRRREMYIMRDKYTHLFLEPTIKAGDLDEMEEDENNVENDTRIDILVINNINKDIPRIISPNVFTV